MLAVFSVFSGTRECRVRDSGRRKLRVRDSGTRGTER
jgi:hypothetical protein